MYYMFIYANLVNFGLIIFMEQFNETLLYFTEL